MGTIFHGTLCTGMAPYLRGLHIRASIGGASRGQDALTPLCGVPQRTAIVRGVRKTPVVGRGQQETGRSVTHS